MNPRWRHILRRTWFTAGGVVAGLAIALAVLMALGQLLLPLAAHYPDRVAHMLSAQLHQPVSFTSMKGVWQPSGPMLVLHDVEIGKRNGKPALTLPTARVKLDFGALVSPSRHWVNLRLSGLRLTLQRDVHGQWHVAGFGATGAGSPQHLTLGDLPGNLWLDNLELDIEDVRSKHAYRVHVGPLRLNSGGGELRFAGLLRRGASRQALKVAGQVHDNGLSGRLYLGANAANFGTMFAGASLGGYAVTSGRGDLALWLHWHDRRLIGVTAQVALTDLDVGSPAGTVKAPQLQGLFQYRRSGDRARVLFAPGLGGAARVDIDGVGGDLHVMARARNFDTGQWLALGALAPNVPVSLRRWLAAAAPGVHLASARFDWSKASGIQSLLVHFDHLGFAAAERRPGIDHLYGVLRGDAEAVSLMLPKQPVTVDFAHVFRKPLVFSSVQGSAAFWRGAQAWHIGTGGINFKNGDMAGQMRGSVSLPRGGGSPQLDLFAAVNHASVVATSRFWPINVMNRQTLDWLDHGLIAGKLDDARVVLHGDMRDWPFTNHRGRFEAHADISGLAIHYQPNWPAARGVDVSADFVDAGMLAVATAGEVHGIKVRHAVASIPDFGKPELILSAQGSGKGSDMIDFVSQSPIGKPHADVLDNLKLNGTSDFDFAMVVPLARNVPGKFTLGGTVRLTNASLDAPAWNVHLGAMNGVMAFDNRGFETRELSATLHGQPVTLNMEVGPQTGNPNWPLKVDMQGNFSLAQLAEGRAQLAALTKAGHGSAAFDIGFHIDNQADNDLHSNEVLSVHTNLQGIALDLPAPLDKPAQAAWPLSFQMGFPFAGGKLQVTLGNRLSVLARLPSKQQPGAVAVNLGGSAATGLPASGIRIRGHVAHLDVSGWVRRALSAVGGPGGQMPPVDVDITADNTSIFGNQFNKLHVKFHPATTQLVLVADGTNIKGSVTVPVHDIGKRGIVARFDRLYLPNPKSSKAGASTPAPAASAMPPVTPQQAVAVGVAPSSLPPLHVWVGDLRLGDANLGQVRLETWPTARGMHIDTLRAQSRSLSMTASGDWNGTATDSHTHMVLDFRAANLGRMLDALGYEGLFQGGQTHAHFVATWPGAPSSFDLANVDGALNVDIGAGRIPMVKPGVGRLFGLMSIAELPRRLTTDFGSMFGKGLGFDSIKGHFRFRDGNAYTRDFALKGPSVNVRVSGRVDFRTHVYDQYVLAVPHIGNSLPIIGAVVGGPVGVAIGLAVQGVLGHGLNKAASVRYHISGPWDKPEITKLPKHAHIPVLAPPSAARASSTQPAVQASH